MESPNDSIQDACNGLARLMEDSPLDALVEALVERQAVVPLIRQMTRICGLEGVYSAFSVPSALLSLAKSNDALRKQIVAEAQKFIVSDPKDFGPGAVVVLWASIKGAQLHDIEEMIRIAQSKKYVSFFLTPCEPGVDDSTLEAAGDALAFRIGEPGHQPRKGVITPEMVGKLLNLLEWTCSQSAPDISSSMQVLREIVLPSSEEDTGEFVYPDEDMKRVNKSFCRMLGKAIWLGVKRLRRWNPRTSPMKGKVSSSESHRKRG